jgi:cytochrome c556
MKRTMIAVAIGAALLMGVAFAHDHEEFEGWMKTTNASFGSMRKTVEAKQGPETAASAEKLAGVFEHVQAHFEDHHMEDGIKFAKTGREAAKDLAAAANAGDWEKASADLKTIGGTCQGCHAAHREKSPDGSYKMK